MRHKDHHFAFSLVELSIVLVILGLLVGGILAGQSLIRASELRSITADINKHTTAIYAFRDKYMALPGDMTNATIFWGKDSSSTLGGACATQTGTASVPGTCNGNGDGYIGIGEYYRSWQQMGQGMAGLMEGQYAGTQPGYGTNAVPGYDYPASKVAGGGFVLIQMTQVNAEFQYTDISFNNNFLFFAGRSSNLPSANILSATEAWNIDTKMDDGKPALGRLYAGQRTSCSTAITSAGEYPLNTTGLRCYLGWKVN